MLQILAYLVFIFFAFHASAKIITLTSSDVNGEQEIRIAFDATEANGTVAANGDIYYDIPVLVISIQDELPDFGYYPNPTQGIVNFSGDILGAIRYINIYNFNGKKVFEKPVSNNMLSPIDISNYKSGLYLLNIVTDQRKYTLKVLVRSY